MLTKTAGPSLQRNLLSLLALVFLCSFAQAQSPCASVYVEAYGLNPQSGAHNYFGVRVTLSATYGQDVTVTGYIHRDVDESSNQDHPFTLTVYAGNLTAETSVTYYQTDPTSGADVTVTSVSPCPGFAVTDARANYNAANYLRAKTGNLSASMLGWKPAAASIMRR